MRSTPCGTAWWSHRARRALLVLAWWLGLWQPPDRAALRRIWATLIRDEPGFRVLFVGVSPHTRRLTRSLERATVVTVDRDPVRRRFGARRHHSIDVAQLAGTGESSFDVAIMNGVLGWGIDSRSDAERALDAVADALTPGGLLVLGVNEGRPSTPPLDQVTALSRFHPIAAPPFGVTRHVVASPLEGAHTFVFLQRG